jgi:hypothetical protein
MKITVNRFFNLSRKDRHLMEWWYGLHLPDWRGSRVFEVWQEGVEIVFLVWARRDDGFFETNFMTGEPYRKEVRVPLICPMPRVRIR